MHKNLFVYGTLRPGEINFHHLESIAGAWQPAIIYGQYFASGSGPAFGYPGIVLDSQGVAIEGQLLTSDNLGQHWVLLDEFEGEGYQRVISTVRLLSGESVAAYVYELSMLGRPATI